MQAALRIVVGLTVVAWVLVGLTACTPVPEGTDIDGDGIPDVPVSELVPVDAGCTYGPGWWKNHHDGAKGSRDQPWPVAENTQLCGQGLLDILGRPPRGDSWYILAHQWIPASLNVANGAGAPSEVVEALEQGGSLLQACAIDDADRGTARGYSRTLGAYNNGDIGPGQCDNVTGPDPVPTGYVECWVGDGVTNLYFSNGGSSAPGSLGTAGIDQVFYTVQTLALNGQSGWLVVSNNTWQVDATAQFPQPTLLVASGDIPVGSYNGTKMELAWVTLVRTDGTLETVDPADFGGDPLMVPGAFDVLDCGTTTWMMAWELDLFVSLATGDIVDLRLDLTGSLTYDLTDCPP